MSITQTSSFNWLLHSIITNDFLNNFQYFFLDKRETEMSLELKTLLNLKCFWTIYSLIYENDYGWNSITNKYGMNKKVVLQYVVISFISNVSKKNYVY